MPPARAIGIDLGTTVTALAYVDESGRSAMVRNLQGDLLIPSAVFFEDDDLLYGRAAKQAAATQPQRAGELVKRDLGQAAYSRAIGGELLPPEVVSGAMLRKICAELPPHIAAKPGVVLAVPSCFDQSQRNATLEAGQIAGLDLLGIIPDPLAAAVAFAELHGYLQSGADKPGCRVLVFDLGGGTLDVAVIEIKPGRVRTLAVGGRSRLGGRDFDLLLAEHLAEVFQKQFGEDPRHDMVSVRRLVESAEEAKMSLTARQQTRVHVERTGHAADITLTRAMFEELSESLVNLACQVTENVLVQSGIARRDLAHMILVGGATRMPMIAKALEKLTDLKPAANIHPDEAVARGAALYADHLLDVRTGRAPRIPLELTDLTAHTLGMEWVGADGGRPENVVLIPRGTELPCSMATRVTTTADGQTSVALEMLQGESRVADECARVAHAEIHGLPAGIPKGWPIQVNCSFTPTGRLQVKAQVERTGQALAVDVRRPAGLHEAQILEWRKQLAAREGLAPILSLAEKQRTIREAQQATAAEAASQVAAAMPVGTAVPPPTSVQQNVGIIEEIQLDPRDASLSRGMRKNRLTPRKIAIMLAGYIISATLGLAIGYYILMRIDPSYNRWNLPLPGVAREPGTSGAPTN